MVVFEVVGDNGTSHPLMQTHAIQYLSYLRYDDVLWHLHARCTRATDV